MRLYDKIAIIFLNIFFAVITFICLCLAVKGNENMLKPLAFFGFVFITVFALSISELVKNTIRQGNTSEKDSIE